MCNYDRYGWVQFANQQTLLAANKTLNGLTLKSFTFPIYQSKSNKSVGRIFENVNSQQALTYTKKLIEAFDKSKNIKDNPLLQPNETRTIEQ